MVPRSALCAVEEIAPFPFAGFMPKVTSSNETGTVSPVPPGADRAATSPDIKNSHERIDPPASHKPSSSRHTTGKRTSSTADAGYWPWI